MVSSLPRMFTVISLGSSSQFGTFVLSASASFAAFEQEAMITASAFFAEIELDAFVFIFLVHDTSRKMTFGLEIPLLFLKPPIVPLQTLNLQSFFKSSQSFLPFAKSQSFSNLSILQSPISFGFILQTLDGRTLESPPNFFVFIR
ncbi:unnamed protein product [Trifolium pratense]|uniref:Uncharacterized protein n=1 Tax=Trifolium pratense TaxID=57577 RepID=A0ACB0J9Y5_TRIPR|nr:unnamed protein product [Trifolium pratense]